MFLAHSSQHYSMLRIFDLREGIEAVTPIRAPLNHWRNHLQLEYRTALRSNSVQHQMMVAVEPVEQIGPDQGRNHQSH